MRSPVVGGVPDGVEVAVEVSDAIGVGVRVSVRGIVAVGTGGRVNVGVAVGALHRVEPTSNVTMRSKLYRVSLVRLITRPPIEASKNRARLREATC